MTFEKPIMTAPTDIITDDDGNVIRIVEHYRQGDHYYDIIQNGNGDIKTMRYSTLSIKRELAKIGKWELTKKMLEDNGFWDDFILANYLSEDDEVIKTTCDALVKADVMSQQQLIDMLAKCIWTPDIGALTT